MDQHMQQEGSKCPALSCGHVDGRQQEAMPVHATTHVYHLSSDRLDWGKRWLLHYMHDSLHQVPSRS